MRNFVTSIVLVSVALFVFSPSTGSAAIPGNNSLADGEDQWPERYHDNIRTMRYPRAAHELFLNPPPLILPQSAKKDSVQFSLSRSLSFPNDTNTINSKYVPWAIFNLHKALTPGQWYWRYRDKTKTGVVGSWSKIDTFTVKAETPRFVAPPLSRMLTGIPTGHPRLFAYLQDAWEQGRSTIANDPEYRDLISRTSGGMTTNYTTVLPISTRLSQINGAVMYFLYPAYVLTGDAKYKNRMVELVRHVLTLPDPQADNGCYKQFVALIYDQCYNDFTEAERLHIEQILVSLLEKEKVSRWYLECHVYENHGLQYDIVDKFRTAVALYGKYPIAREYLDYCYATWVGRAPMGGFVRDGGNFNGIGYFGVDGFSIHYMAGILSNYTGFDFNTHPWYQELGKVALYSYAPQSGTLGFGDGHSAVNPPPGWTAFVDIIARQTQDPYAQWYVNKCGNAKNDYSLRMYRLGLSKTKPINPSATLPDNRPKALWLKDCGEAYIHSDIVNYSTNDLGLSLRASTYGSGSHCIADNNSFIMTYKGQLVYQNSGYYNAGMRHNLLSERHTQAHNSILVDGIGQPMSTLDFANLARVQDGKNISYALGDASHAYAHLTDYTQWTVFMASEKITQTPEFGFGITSLKRFRRHVLMLHPDKVLIYDDLEAGTPVRWDWLLHSANQFEIEEPNKRIVLEKNTSPLAKVESGTIHYGCGTLSFDYVQSGSENVNLEVYVNNQLIKTISTTNEQGTVKKSGDITVNKSGDFTIQFRQKNASSGQVAIDNLKWTLYFATGTPDIRPATPRSSVKPGNGTIEVTTTQGGQIKVYSVLGQSVATMNVFDGQHLVRVTPGVYLVSFISGGKTETSKVVVK